VDESTKGEKLGEVFGPRFGWLKRAKSQASEPLQTDRQTKQRESHRIVDEHISINDTTIAAQLICASRTD